MEISIWAMMAFPGLPDSKVQEFERQDEAVRVAEPSTVVQEIESADKDTELSSEARKLKEHLKAVHSKKAEPALRFSVARRIGTTLEKNTQFAGFDWRTNIVLVGGFETKEVVVSILDNGLFFG